MLFILPGFLIVSGVEPPGAHYVGLLGPYIRPCLHFSILNSEKRMRLYLCA